ncbi:hypothetical protein JYT44_03300 [Caldithrix abyssi]|nr:hypothetical protein [Caldithrix abyssi]
MQSTKSIKDGQPIVFLFIQGLHHLYHMVSIPFECAKIIQNHPIQIVSVTQEHTKILEEFSKKYPNHKCEIITLPLPLRYRFFNYKNKSHPSLGDSYRKVKPLLKKAGAIISTSHPTPGILRKMGILKPIMIYIEHGCGNQKYSFEAGLGQYDFLLLFGKNNQTRLAEENVAEPEKTNIIGYPKFDSEVSIKDLRRKLFNQDRKIVYYAPHWNPKLTSYKKWANKILDFFRNDENYNLIFAPHMLLKHWSYKYNYDLDYSSGDNIHIDFGSRLSVDTSYIQLADYYIGDVSSLIYEWMGIRPRPAIFLNAHDVNWQNNKDYVHWEYGPVIDDIKKLPGALKKATESHWLELQAERIKGYMDINEQSSSRRAAFAILNRLESLKKF